MIVSGQCRILEEILVVTITTGEHSLGGVLKPPNSSQSDLRKKVVTLPSVHDKNLPDLLLALNDPRLNHSKRPILPMQPVRWEFWLCLSAKIFWHTWVQKKRLDYPWMILRVSTQRIDRYYVY